MLAECGEIVAGGTPSRANAAYWGGDVPWMSAKSLKRFTVSDSEDRLTAAGASVATLAPPGSVLFVVRGMSLATEFRVGVTQREVAFNQDLRAILPRDGVDGRYLGRLLQASSRELLSLTDEASHGTKRLTSDRVEAFSIPLPPTDEQRRIAEILDKADELRAMRRAVLTQLGTLTQSIFVEMFGDSVSILTSWPKQQLGDLLAFLTSGSRGWAEYYADTGDLFLRIQNVKRDHLSLQDVAYVRAPQTAEAKRTRVEAGDVLLSITADLGRTAVIPEGLGPAYINQHLSILRTTELEPRYLSAYLSSPIGQRQVGGRNRQGVKAGLNFDDIRSFTIPVPPRSLQREFVSRASEVEKVVSTQIGSSNKLEELFASLQYRAFRGEL